jgi:hypothetical protein
MIIGSLLGFVTNLQTLSISPSGQPNFKSKLRVTATSADIPSEKAKA